MTMTKMVSVRMVVKVNVVVHADAGMCVYFDEINCFLFTFFCGGVIIAE